MTKSFADRGHEDLLDSGTAERLKPRPIGKRLFACYISGMDLRRLNHRDTPFMADLLASYPWTAFRNLPSNELFPTIVTGVDPTAHGVWGVKLAPLRGRDKADLFVRLPDWLTTTAQGCLHFLTNACDLAAIPPRRRRRFTITRTKYKRRSQRPEALFNIGGFPTILGIVGQDRSRYWFNSASKPQKYLLPSLCVGTCALELLELYSIDRYQQWHLDNPENVRRFYGVIDDFLRQLAGKCAAAGMSLMIFSDHGHEPIKTAIDIVALLHALPVPARDYSYFTEVSSIRLWFHTAEARRRIAACLSRLEHGSLVTYQEMARYNVPLKDAAYGEMFFFLDPGYIFFPHDFYQPVANAFLGLSDRMQVKRIRDPRHRGNHGHLPHFDAERSFVVLADKRCAVESGEAHILDLAPSMLALLDRGIPPYMKGRPLFKVPG
jgi:hypothetical protein